jgi:hypothetical protein
MAEDRTSIWEYINPFEDFTSPTRAFIYGPYRSLARGQAFFPGLLPTQGWMASGLTTKTGMMNKVIGGAWEGMTTQSFRTGSVGKFIGTAGRFLMFGGGSDMGPEAKMIADRGMSGAAAFYSEQAARPGTMGLKTKLAGMKSLRSLGSRNVMAKSYIIGAARVINPILNLYMAYQMTSWAVETAFKGVRATADTINRASDRISNLELGGDLSHGYLGEQAATERQRALQAIQSSHLSGRRFMGNEASMYHA